MCHDCTVLHGIKLSLHVDLDLFPGNLRFVFGKSRDKFSLSPVADGEQFFLSANSHLGFGDLSASDQNS